MRVSITLRRLMASVLVVIGLVGCGGSQETQTADNESSTGLPRASTAVSTRPEPSEPEPSSLCALLPAEEIEAAFAGKLDVEVDYGGERDCQYTFPAFDGGQIILQLAPKGNYDLKKLNLEEGRVSGEYIEGLGLEAMLLNNSQVEVLLDDEQYLSLVLILITFGVEPPITQQEAAAGLTNLARMAVDRL